MKDFITKVLETSIRWMVGALVGVGTAYFAVEAWVDGKVEAAESRVMVIRSVDMKHIDQRLDSVDRKLNILIQRDR